jgi:undecaprenyl-diphosphatase
MDIIYWDRILFSWINHRELPPFLDSLMVGIRHPLFWVPLYVFTIAFFVINFRKKGIIYIGFLLLVFGFGDMISSRILKPSVMRLRPCRHEAVWVVERVRCGGTYGFPSSHATNHFALATFIVLTLGMQWKKIKSTAWSWATMVSVAQIYVGVHFPLDIVGGASLGILIGGALGLYYSYKVDGIFSPSLDSLTSYGSK